MPDEEIKKAFQRVKEDVFYLGEDITNLRLELLDIKKELRTLNEYLEKQKIASLESPTHEQKQPTFQQINPTIPTNNSSYNHKLSPNNPSSIGNEGVPTDRQTDQQTDRHISNTSFSTQNSSLNKAGEILENLDNLKKEIRLKIKRLTDQEMKIFALIYSLEEQGEAVDYKILANKTNLSESSIRDYVLKITNKNLPITKEKLNNKRVLLNISPDFKKIASLDTLLRLREV